MPDPSTPVSRRSDAAGGRGRQPAAPRASSGPRAARLVGGGAAGAARLRRRSPRCAPTRSDDTYAGLRAGPDSIRPQRAPATTQRAQREISASRPPATSCSQHTQLAAAALDQATAAGAGPERAGRHGAGDRARASGSPSRGTRRPVSVDHLLDGRGAAQRRCRGDADQRPGPGDRPDLVRGGRPAASRRRPGAQAAVSPRRHRRPGHPRRGAAVPGRLRRRRQVAEDERP